MLRLVKVCSIIFESRKQHPGSKYIKFASQWGAIVRDVFDKPVNGLPAQSPYLLKPTKANQSEPNLHISVPTQVSPQKEKKVKKNR